MDGARECGAESAQKVVDAGKFRGDSMPFPSRGRALGAEILAISQAMLLAI
jgi:hypothetical protein